MFIFSPYLYIWFFFVFKEEWKKISNLKRNTSINRRYASCRGTICVLNWIVIIYFFLFGKNFWNLQRYEFWRFLSGRKIQIWKKVSNTKVNFIFTVFLVPFPVLQQHSYYCALCDFKILILVLFSSYTRASKILYFYVGHQRWNFDSQKKSLKNLDFHYLFMWQIIEHTCTQVLVSASNCEFYLLSWL